MQNSTFPNTGPYSGTPTIVWEPQGGPGAEMNSDCMEAPCDTPFQSHYGHLQPHYRGEQSGSGTRFLTHAEERVLNARPVPRHLVPQLVPGVGATFDRTIPPRTSYTYSPNSVMIQRDPYIANAMMSSMQQGVSGRYFTEASPDPRYHTKTPIEPSPAVQKSSYDDIKQKEHLKVTKDFKYEEGKAAMVPGGSTEAGTDQKQNPAIDSMSTFGRAISDEKTTQTAAVDLYSLRSLQDKYWRYLYMLRFLETPSSCPNNEKSRESMKKTIYSIAELLSKRTDTPKWEIKSMEDVKRDIEKAENSAARNGVAARARTENARRMGALHSSWAPWHFPASKEATGTACLQEDTRMYNDIRTLLVEEARSESQTKPKDLDDRLLEHPLNASKPSLPVGFPGCSQPLSTEPQTNLAANWYPPQIIFRKGCVDILRSSRGKESGQGGSSQPIASVELGMMNLNLDQDVKEEKHARTKRDTDEGWVQADEFEDEKRESEFRASAEGESVFDSCEEDEEEWVKI